MKAYDKEKLKFLVETSLTFTEVLRKSGKRSAGGNFEILKKYIAKYKLDISHFNPDIAKLNASKSKAISLEQILVKDSNFNRGHLKNRLYKENLKKRNCEICNQGEEWRGKKNVINSRSYKRYT